MTDVSAPKVANLILQKPPTDKHLSDRLLAGSTTKHGVDIPKLAHEFSAAAKADPHGAIQSAGRLLQRLTPVEQGSFLRQLGDSAVAKELRATTNSNGRLPHFVSRISGNEPVPSLPPHPGPHAPPAITAPTPEPPAHVPVFDGTDKHVGDWLDGLGGAVSQGDKNKLAQVGNDARLLSNFEQFTIHNGPVAAPQNVADAQKRLTANPAIAKQIEYQSGEAKGAIDPSGLDKFLGNLDKAADRAKGSWDAFKKDNPSPDPIALRSAAEASILQANLPVLDAAGTPGAKVDGLFNTDDLKAVAGWGIGIASPAAHAAALAVNTAEGVPAPLIAAASHYSDEGEFHKLDQAGVSEPSAKFDGLVSNDNIDYYLANSTSKSLDDTVTDLKTSAIEQAVKTAGGDATKVNGDYFKDPSKSSASGADKAAAMIQMSETLARYHNGESYYVDPNNNVPNALHSPKEWHDTYGPGPTPGEQRGAYIKDIEDKVETLSKDKDVQTFLTEKLPQALQGMVSGDPGLKDSFETAYKETSNSQALEHAFTLKDENGKPLTTTAALSSFLQNPNFFALGLGIKPDYQPAFKGVSSTIQDKIIQGYHHVTSGDEFTESIKDGKTANDALFQSTIDQIPYATVLDKDTVDKGNGQWVDFITAKVREDLYGNLTTSQLIGGLGFTSADDPRLLQFIQAHMNELVPPGTPAGEIKPEDLASDLRRIEEIGRGGIKFDDSFSKFLKSMGLNKPYGGIGNAGYKYGAFHALSGLMLAGAMGVRLGIHDGSSNPLLTTAQTFQTAGLLTEGGSRFALANRPGEPADAASERNKVDLLKKIENVGKALGGFAGNALGVAAGALGAKDAFAAGDTAGGAVNSAFAGLQGLGSVATAGEIGAFLAPKVASWVSRPLSAGVVSSVEAAGGLFGAVAGGATGIAAAGALLYNIISSAIAENKQTANEHDWYQELKDGFTPAGTPLPDFGTLTSAPNGYVYDDGLSPVAPG